MDDKNKFIEDFKDMKINLEIEIDELRKVFCGL